MILMHIIGRKSGKEYIIPLRATPAGASLYIFASNHGSERHPDWYHNLIANPDIDIEKGAETIPIRATEVTGKERETIFNRHAARFPIFAEWQQTLSRTIPVIRLDPRPE